MDGDMPKRARAARDAHMALLDLKKVIEEAARATHSAELEAVHLAVGSGKTDHTYSKLRSVLEQLSSVEATLAKARQSLQTAIS